MLLNEILGKQNLFFTTLKEVTDALESYLDDYFDIKSFYVTEQTHGNEIEFQLSFYEESEDDKIEIFIDGQGMLYKLDDDLPEKIFEQIYEDFPGGFLFKGELNKTVYYYPIRRRAARYYEPEPVYDHEPTVSFKFNLLSEHDLQDLGDCFQSSPSFNNSCYNSKKIMQRYPDLYKLVTDVYDKVSKGKLSLEEGRKILKKAFGEVPVATRFLLY